MVTVAIVGGTGNVGKTLVDAFVADGKHKVIVIARKVPEKASPAPVFAVDYTNDAQLKDTLEQNNVHTVISTILMLDPVSAEAERNMIAAADKATCTKRFVASSWGAATPEDESIHLPFHAFRGQSVEALRKTSLEWTRFHNGLFLDYYGIPHVETYLTPLAFGIDIASRKAAIPGSTGNEVMSVTYTKDLGKFAVAAMGLEKWDEALSCYSEMTTFNRLIEAAEEATGDKFDVGFDPMEKLQRAEITELPSHVHMYSFFPKPHLAGLLSRFGIWVVTGDMRVQAEDSLNERFPEIKTANVKEIVGAWKGN
ncbi:nmra-like family protein [Stemphylium lycopersici]|nr:nmra-like family protein [Stemphylium lycopersici]